MKRHNDLFKRIVSFENLYNASMSAQRSKRYKDYVLTFNAAREANLIALQTQLTEKTYTPGEYKKFTIYEPKLREISAAPYVDRIVHHALCNVIEPIFDNTFISQSFANRIGKGTHKAASLFREYAYSNQYVLKCDIKKYFPSIDHEILKRIIRSKIKDKDTLWLINRIIDNSNPQLDNYSYFTGDDLFTPFERRKGIPIGNLTSQFFANIYLSQLDHFVKENLGCSHFIRYVDDFVIFGNDKKILTKTKGEVIFFLESLRLNLHDKKAYICPVSYGVRFLGYKIFPNRIELLSQNIHRFKKRMIAYRSKLNSKKVSLNKVKQSFASWRGYAMQSSSSFFPEKIIRQIVL